MRERNDTDAGVRLATREEAQLVRGPEPKPRVIAKASASSACSAQTETDPRAQMSQTVKSATTDVATLENANRSGDVLRAVGIRGLVMNFVERAPTLLATVQRDSEIAARIRTVVERARVALENAPQFSDSALQAADLGDYTQWQTELAAWRAKAQATDEISGDAESSVEPAAPATAGAPPSPIPTVEHNEAQIAARGTAGPGQALPHLQTIQQAFGRHDVSSVRAHIGGEAAVASRSLGARAYAYGDAVAFVEAPDVHTAAHEAAHVVQQRHGVSRGIARGDDYERHADLVADAVVSGESAEQLLNGSVGAGGQHDSLVQRKKATSSTASDLTAPNQPELVHTANAPWPVFAKSGQPYIIEDSSGRPAFWVARAWIAAASDMTRVGNAMRSPSRARELLIAMGWVDSAHLAFAASQLTFTFFGALSRFEISAEAAHATGMPQGRQAIVDRGSGRLGNKAGLTVTVMLDDPSVEPGRPHEITASETQRIVEAAATFTGLDVDPEGHASLMQRVKPRLVTGSGVIAIALPLELCEKLFGSKAYHAWLGGKPQLDHRKDPETPKLKLENYYNSPIPGRITHHGDIVESTEDLRLEVAVDWPHHYPDSEIYAAPPMWQITDRHVVARLSCEWKFERLDGQADGPVPKGSIETQSTTLAEATHAFRLAPGEDKGVFRVTCNARFDEYFEPTSFTRDVVVLSPAEALSQLKSQAFAGLGAPTTDRSESEWTGDVRKGFRPTPAVESSDAVADPMAADRAGQRQRLRDIGEYLRDKPASSEAVEAIERELARQERSEELIAADRDRGWQPFQIRGTYLSRTEGLPSGPLDLHGTVHLEAGVSSRADWESTNHGDKVVVKIRDLSRRFEQSDFVFTGRGHTFDQALHDAFDDLAVAYPKGLVSIEAEQIRPNALRTADGRPGTEAALGPGTGKVIGFHRTTDTLWKKTKEMVWDSYVGIALNAAAIAIMVLVPGSAAIVAPVLVAYNSVPAVDNIATQSSRGTLTVRELGISTGEIALNLLPFVSRAKPFTAGWFTVETANWGGQVALMGAGAVDMAKQLQATHVTALAQEYQEFLQLQKTSLPSDPELGIAEERIRRKAAEVDGEISRQFWKQVKSNGFQLVAGSVIHNASSKVRDAVVKHVTGQTGGAPADPSAGHSGASGQGSTPPHGGSSPVPPHNTDPASTSVDGTGHTPAGTPPSSQHEPTRQQPASEKLIDVAAANKHLREDGGKFRADATDLHHVHATWSEQAKGATVTPLRYDAKTNTAHFDVLRNGERIRIVADIAPRITVAAELASSANRVVGNPIRASEGYRLLRQLNEGQLEALAAVGVEVSPGTKLVSEIEFGLGEIDKDHHVVVLGEPSAVDWAHLPGLTPKAHTHPSKLAGDLVKVTGTGSVPLSRLLENTPVPLNEREVVFPSPPDIGLMARLRIDGHRVITPFALVDGHVTKPRVGESSSRLEWVIQQPREAGRMASGDVVYEATLVGEFGGQVVARVNVWSVEPRIPTIDNPSRHLMAPPAMVEVSTRPLASSKKTPTSGPRPTDPTARLTTGPEAITTLELEQLRAKHGSETVEWVGESLAGTDAKQLLDALEKATLDGMRDVPAIEALNNLHAFGKANIERVIPPLTGSLLKVEREQLGRQTSRGVVERKLNDNKLAALEEHANNLAEATRTVPVPLTTHSIVTDSNVLAGIKELMLGDPWSKLDAHKRNGINWLRRHANPPLSELTTDPLSRDFTSLIGEGHDLRAANNTLGESAPLTGLDRSGFELTISRDSPQYESVLRELESLPVPIGENNGAGDRSIVADTMFAASPGIPRLMTGDYSMIKTLFKRYCLEASSPPKQKPGESLAQAIATAYPSGYKAEIPDGLGGKRTIIVIAMVH